MAGDAESATRGGSRTQGQAQRDARRELNEIRDRHDGLLREAKQCCHERGGPAREDRFWAAIDGATRAAARLYDTAGRFGLDWVNEGEQATVSRLLQSASEELSPERRALITLRVQRLWDAWATERPLPAIRALNLRNVAALALACPGDDGDGFEALVACLSEHLGLPSWVRAKLQGERPLLVSSLVDPRLAAAWVVKEAAAELVPPLPLLATLPASLQALSLDHDGLFADAGLMHLVYGDNAALVGLHQEWRTLARALPDPHERAHFAEDLAAASPAARVQFGVYVLSGEIAGTLDRVLPAHAQPDAWRWACRFAHHYATGAGTQADRLAHAEACVAAEIGRAAGDVA